MAIRILVVLCLALSWSFAQAEDIRVAVVKSQGMLPYEDVVAGFKQKMPDAALIRITVHNPSQLYEQIAAVKPQLLLCLGSKALESASEIREIPKIAALIPSSAAAAYVRRSDIAGVVIDLPFAMQFKILRQAFPKSGRIGVIYNPEFNQRLIDEAERSARAFHFQLVKRAVRSIKEIPTALNSLTAEIDLLWSVYDQTVYGPESAKYILLYALRKNIPFIGFSAHFATAGAILGLYGNYEDMGRQAAQIAEKYLNREPPGPKWMDPRSVKIAINSKVANAMGIAFPEAITRITDKVY